MRRPILRTTLPGPKGAELIARDHRFLSRSLPREYPLVAVKGEGVWLSDPDGNEFLDFTSGIAVCNTGHCHPQVTRAAKDQLDRLLHMCSADFYTTPMVDLAEKLAAVAPGPSPKRIYFGNSGAEAVESGLKLARYQTGRREFIAFLGAFHGRTMGALSLTASKATQKRNFGPFVPGVRHVPYAHCYRCAYNLEYPACDLQCIQYIEDVLFKQVLVPEEIAAIVVEPIQGEGGYIVPPPDYHKRLKNLAEQYGILYMVDEIQTGMGRTGKMYAIEHFGIEPDLLTTAKGIASGLPLSALVAREEIMNWTPGAHGSTYGGNPVASAAALASIEVIEQGLVDNAARMGPVLRQGLETIRQTHEAIGDIRGLGLMQAVELVRDRESKEPNKALRNKILTRCFENGLLLLSCGESTVRFCPPLLVDADQISVALEIFEQVMLEIGNEKFDEP